MTTATLIIKTSTGNPTYNLPAIMKSAWAAYDKYNCLGDRSRFKFNRVFFASMLAATWQEAHAEMKAAKLAALPQADKANRRAKLESSLAGLDYLPSGMNVSRRAAAIQSEIASLAA